MSSQQEVSGRTKRRQQHRQRLSQSLRQNLGFRDQQVLGGPQCDPASDDAWCLREQPPTGIKLWEEIGDLEKAGQKNEDAP